MSRTAVEPVAILLAPFAPHLAEECWEVLGHKKGLFLEGTWPAYDERLAATEQVELVVQVNGKVRSRLTVPRGLAEKQVVELALKDESVKKYVDGGSLKKVVFVQDRLVNLVV